MARKIPKTNINLGNQKFHLDTLIHPKKSIILDHCLIWEAYLQPTRISRRYLIRLKYRINDRPIVHVLEPDIVAEAKAKGRNLPHVFHGAELCLFRLAYNDWNSNIQLSVSIIPWISEWLFFYEIWLATGEWEGGGEHTNIEDKEKNSNIILED